MFILVVTPDRVKSVLSLPGFQTNHRLHHQQLPRSLHGSFIPSRRRGTPPHSGTKTGVPGRSDGHSTVKEKVLSNYPRPRRRLNPWSPPLLWVL